MEKGRFPNMLKLYRRSSGLSRKKVARMLGLTNTSMLSRWELGIGLPNAVQVFRLARIFNTYPHELFDELWQASQMTEGVSAHDEPEIS